MRLLLCVSGYFFNVDIYLGTCQSKTVIQMFIGHLVTHFVLDKFHFREQLHTHAYVLPKMYVLFLAWFINPFLASVPILYPLKTKPLAFWCFQGL